jgi:hypothetical protein
VNRYKSDVVRDAGRLKKALRARFPATAFSVRLSRGTGYGNCHVSWTDGPTEKVVRSITDAAEGKKFDAMQDLGYHVPAAFPDGVESSLGYILTGRSYSREFALRLLRAVGDFWNGPGSPIPAMGSHPSGEWRIEGGDAPIRPDLRETWNEAIWQAGADASRYRRA